EDLGVPVAGGPSRPALADRCVAAARALGEADRDAHLGGDRVAVLREEVAQDDGCLLDPGVTGGGGGHCKLEAHCRAPLFVSTTYAIFAYTQYLRIHELLQSRTYSELAVLLQHALALLAGAGLGLLLGVEAVDRRHVAGEIDHDRGPAAVAV